MQIIILSGLFYFKLSHSHIDFLSSHRAIDLKRYDSAPHFMQTPHILLCLFILKLFKCFV